MEEEFLRKARALIRDPDMITDSKEHSVLWVSKGFTKRTGYVLKDFRGRNILDYFEFNKLGAIGFLLSLKLRKSGSLNVRVVLKSGKKAAYRVKFSELIHKGRSCHVAKIMG